MLYNPLLLLVLSSVTLFIGVVNTFVGYNNRAFSKEGGYGDHVPDSELAGADKRKKANEVLRFWGVTAVVMSTPLLAYMLHLIMIGEAVIPDSLKIFTIVYMACLIIAANYPLYRIKSL